MKIRRLEIQGFKSFADRTVFDFGPGISAIVGPNGCGKSNVVDAIKWVLGDMSPRSLRGKRMEDVIFAGSRHRKPMGMAEVTLVLDNEDGLLKTERTEVSITRRLHRTGESEYLLNGDSGRLKDIRELFLDTGLGIEGNSIMEQGQIDALLAASPDDRRGIFEEAAGVSRYKQRKKEAEQRLLKTDENLVRLRDVLDLEEKRWRSLKAQAARARRYTELREELAKKRTLRAVLRYREVSRDRAGLDERMREALAREESAARELALLDEKAKDLEREREVARESVHLAEGRVAAAASDARAARDRADYASRTAEELRGRVAEARRVAQEARERIERLARERERLDAEAAQATGLARDRRAVLATAEGDLSRVEAESARLKDAHDGTKREALAALGRIGDARNEEAERRAETRQYEERLQRLERQRAEQAVALERAEGEAHELTALAARMDEESRAMGAAVEAAEGRRLVAREEAETARIALATLLEERASKRARLDLLERLAASREGIDAGARAVLAEVEGLPPEADGSRGGVLGLLAELVSPEGRGAHLLDLLLGPGGGALVVRTTNDALRWLAWLRHHEGDARARFLCLDLVRSEAPPLPDEVGEVGGGPTIGALVRSVASGARLVPDLPEAIREWRTTGSTLVTPEGDRVTASGALLGGADGPTLGLVERTAEVRALRADLARLAAEVENRQAAIRVADEALRSVEEEIRRLRADLAHRAEDRSRRSEALVRVEKERRRVAEGLEVLVAEATEVSRALEETRVASLEVGERVARLEAERNALEERAEEAARGFLALEAERKASLDRRMEARVALAEAEGRAEGAAGQAARAAEESSALEARAAGHDREAAELEARIGRLEAEVAEAEAAVREREAARVVGGEELLALRRRLADLESSGGTDLERKSAVERLYEEVRRELESFRLKDGELRVRMEALVEQVRLDQGLDLVAVEREAPVAEGIDPEAAEREVEDLRQKMEALGNVNLNAIPELEEVERQVETLRAQEKDLLEAKATLQQGIGELDEVSRARFAETFEKVREHFHETFRRLFGGGRAELVLEDAANPLESGVDIIARPPGKEPRSIGLLSGGERTLTATALLFAVFQTRPSPFSILDEVDAALDEANVRRLVSLVKEFTDRSQFLIVTHAKTTMEAADVLYGVTMEEAGVSKKVAVRLTEFPSETPEAVAAG
jgi:chromosome segregation protein